MTTVFVLILAAGLIALAAADNISSVRRLAVTLIQNVRRPNVTT
jgi:hypothetical protein